MEPAMGASTCALGSQRWTPYRGALTMKASRRARLVRGVVQESVGGVRGVSLIMGRSRVPVWVCKWSKVTRRGRELMRV